MRGLTAGCVVVVALVAAQGAAASKPSRSGWQLQRLPRGFYPADGTGAELDGVSCVSDAACMAAGTADGSTVVVRFTGRRWRVQHTPKFAGGLEDSVTPGGVSCSSQAVCAMAGTYQSNTAFSSYARRWNGRKWSTESFPSRTSDIAINGVSCASRHACMAVGHSGHHLISVHWNGRRWTLQRAHRPTRFVFGDLDAVSCPTPTMCIAVGDYQQKSGNDRPLAERWNGKRWSIETARRWGAGATDLSGVSCPSPAVCVAVGTFANPHRVETSSITEFWNGSRWSRVAAPGEGLVAVSCYSRSLCLAAGTSQVDPTNGATDIPTADWWNGKRWSLLHPIRPKITDPVDNTSDFGLNGVSCPSSTTCFTVGDWGDASGAETAFVERFRP